MAAALTRRARPHRGRALVWAVPLLLACGRSEAPPPSSAPDDEPSAGALPEAVRPPWRLVEQRLGERCQLRVEHADGRVDLEPETVACPRDLEDGERVRLSGRTCLREGGPTGVARPIGCPRALLELEARLREPAASAAP